MDFNISNIPSTNIQNVGYRRNMSSSTFNENQQYLLNDLLNLYNNSNELNKKLTAFSSSVMYENMYLRNLVSDLALEVKEIQNSMETGLDREIRIQASNCYSENRLGADVSIKYNSISCKPRNITDLLHTSGVLSKYSSHISNTLCIEAETLTSNTKDYDSNILDCLKDDASVWVRTIRSTTDNTSVEVQVTLILSPDILTTLDLNEISFNTFPFGNINIKNIEFKHSNDVWRSVPNVEFHSAYMNKRLEGAGSERLIFPTIKANAIRFTLEQGMYVDEGDNRVFHLGLRQLKVLNNKFDEKDNYFGFQVELPHSGCTIEKIAPSFNNYEDNENLINFEYYYEDENSVTHRLTDSLPFICPVSRLVVRGKIKHSSVNPCISSFLVSYKATKY